MTNKQLLAALKDHSRARRGQLGDVMTATGCAESTVRRWIERDKMPRNPIVREALEKFLAKNGAKK